MLAVAGLAIGNSFPLIPCQRIAAGCSAQVQLHSPGGMTDAVVATIAFAVLVITWPAGSPPRSSARGLTGSSAGAGISCGW
jgi:hypothetical protein